jgi:hypothetical protein
LVSFVLKGAAPKNNYVMFYAKEKSSNSTPKLIFNYAIPREPEESFIPTDENNVAIFPNPVSSDLINVFVALKNETAQIRLCNLQGKVIRIITTSIDLNSVPVDDLQNGLYLVQIIKSDKVITKRLEVMR